MDNYLYLVKSPVYSKIQLLHGIVISELITSELCFKLIKLNRFIDLKKKVYLPFDIYRFSFIKNQIARASGQYIRRIAMINSVFNRLIFAAFILFIQGTILFAQNPNTERGLSGHSYLSNNFDHVNLYNGNIGLTVPIGQSYKVGGNLDYQMTLIYNSNMWDFKVEEQVAEGERLERVKALPDPKSNAGLGWRLSFGALYPPNTPVYNEENSYLYVAPDGSSHQFYPQLSLGVSQQGALFSGDGALMRLRLTGPLRIEFPDGQVHYFGSNFLLTKIEDPFGNKVEVDTASNPLVWYVRDRCGNCGNTYTREHTIEFDSPGGQVIRASLSAQPSSGGRAVYEFVYESRFLPRHNKNTWLWSSNQFSVNVKLLREIKFPANAGSYKFDYNPNGFNPSGAVRSATLPTGGHYKWDYTPYQRPIRKPEDPICVPYCPDALDPISSTDGIAYKEIYNKETDPNPIGRFEYNPGGVPQVSDSSLADTTVIVKSPNGDETVNYFNLSFDEFGWPEQGFGLPYTRLAALSSPNGTLYLSQEMYKGTVAGGQKLRSVYVRYVLDPRLEPGGPGANFPGSPRVEEQRTVYEDGKQASQFFSDWNGLGKFRQTQTSGTFDHGNRRSSFIDYSPALPALNQPWILNLYTQQSETEGTSTATTQYCFEDTTGFLKRKRVMIGANPDTKDILLERVRNDNGEVTSDKYFGGDVKHNAPTGGICSITPVNPEYQEDHTYSFGSLATSKYAGTAFFSVENVIDQNTGLTTISRDVAGVATRYQYDALGRITNVDAAGDADEVYTYSPATDSLGAQTIIDYKLPSDGSGLSRKKVTYDPFGRSAREEERLPGGSFSVHETKYDAMGWKLSVSEAGAAEEYSNYDPFGRAGTVKSPDGSISTIAYTGVSAVEKTASIGTSVNAAGIVSTSNVKRNEFYDRQGRLVEVREGSGPNNAMVPTTYEYDIGKRLKSVQTAATIGPAIPGNVALASNGATAASSSVANGSFPPAAAINGDRKGLNWGNGGGWNDGSPGDYSTDWVQVAFNGPKNINEIDVYTLRSNWSTAAGDPTPTETFNTADNTGLGIMDFDVQYLSGSGWKTVPGGRVIGNNLVWRKLAFTAVNTTAIRISVHKSAPWTTAANNYSRIVEIEAYQSGVNVARPLNGGSAAASSTVNTNFPVGAVIDGDRTGRNWGNGGGWNDGTENQFGSDWLQVNFAAQKTIGEIDVFTLQDNYSNPVEPTAAQTFLTADNSGLGVTYFEVQYWNGSRWLTVPGGLVNNNSNVWKKLTFSPVITSAIRVVVRGAVTWTSFQNNYSRIVELEAYESTQAAPVSQVTQTRTFNYDNRGFLTSETHPEIIGTVTYGQYDTRGNIGQKIEGSSNVLYSYDSAGRTVSLREGTGTEQRMLKEFEYYTDNAPGSDDARLGKLKKATRVNWVLNPYSTNPGATEIPVKISEEYTYRGRSGRLDSRLTKLNAENPTPYQFYQTFTYNELGDLQNQSYPQCQNATCVNSGDAVPRTVKYEYEQGFLNRVWNGNAASPVNYASSITYHQNQMINTVVHGNGVTDTYERNSSNGMNRPHRIRFNGTNVNWNSGEYKYDGIGNVINMVAAAGVVNDWFVYDHVNRIVEGTAGVSSSNQRRKQQYSYDAFGNIININTQQDINNLNSEYVNSVNPATNRLTYYYDNSGNFQGVAAPNMYVYDSLNMMKKAPGKTYLYGPNDERMWIVDKGYNDLGQPPSTVPPITQTVTLRGLNNEVLREYEINGVDAVSNWAWKKDYVYRARQLLATETPTGRRHYHLDHLGSARIVTNDAGSQVESYQYFPYGADAVSTGSERLKFTGHERDYATNGGHNLDYMHARFYSMNNGRFISVDPGRDFDLQQPQSWNRYSYVRGNPVNKTDPTGRVVENSQSGQATYRQVSPDLDGNHMVSPEEQRQWETRQWDTAVQGNKKALEVIANTDVLKRADDLQYAIATAGAGSLIKNLATAPPTKTAVIGLLSQTKDFIGKKGFNVLNIKKWTLEKNMKWLDKAWSSGGKFRLLSSPQEAGTAILHGVSRGVTAREYQRLHELAGTAVQRVIEGIF
jgi:RHS repeat-associated protein